LALSGASWAYQEQHAVVGEQSAEDDSDAPQEPAAAHEGVGQSQNPCRDKKAQPYSTVHFCCRSTTVQDTRALHGTVWYYYTTFV